MFSNQVIIYGGWLADCYSPFLIVQGEIFLFSSIRNIFEQECCLLMYKWEYDFFAYSHFILRVFMCLVYIHTGD